MKIKKLKFSEDMKTAIRDGRKTQTRRPIDPQPEGDKVWFEPEYPGGPRCVSSPLDTIRQTWESPYGPVGTRHKINNDTEIEIVSIRVERVNEISDDDAFAEGCRGTNCVRSSPYISGWHTGDGELPSEEFRELWNSIYGKTYPWESNPWVWVYEFRRLE